MSIRRTIIKNIFRTVAAAIGTFAIVHLSYAANGCAERKWKLNDTFKSGDVITLNGHNYKIRQPHTAYASNWTPENTPALWTDLGKCEGSAGKQKKHSQTATVEKSNNKKNQKNSTEKNPKKNNTNTTIVSNKPTKTGAVPNIPVTSIVPNTTSKVTQPSVQEKVIKQTSEGELSDTTKRTQTVIPPDEQIKISTKFEESQKIVAAQLQSATSSSEKTAVQESQKKLTQLQQQFNAAIPKESTGPERKATLTHYESYPAPGSDECVNYNGCTWAGYFSALPDKMPESWVKANNICAVHEKDFKTYKLKTLRLKQGSKQVDCKVYDQCSDSDCDGCCTKNAGKNGFLIDVEKYTAQRFGASDGTVTWTCVDCKQ